MSVRYQLKLSVAMNPTVSLTFYDELQLRVPAAGKRVFDQNIIFAGFDFNLDKKKRWKLEVGVLNQSYWNSQETMSGRKRINHTLRMGVTFNAPFHTH
jgi:hypothetical protein